MAPQKRTVRLEKKNTWNPGPGVFSVRRLSMGQREVDPSLTSFTSATSESCRAKNKNNRKPWKSGGFYWIFSKTIMAIVFLLVNFFWQLASSFFGGIPN